jgi:hypothetical protein
VTRSHKRTTSQIERHSRRKRLTISSSTVSPGRSDGGPDMKRTSARSKRFGSLRGHSTSRRRNMPSQSFAMTMPEGAMVTTIRSPLVNWITAVDLGVCRMSLFTPDKMGTTRAKIHSGTIVCAPGEDCSRKRSLRYLSGPAGSFLVLLVVAPGCSDESTRLSVDEATRCARER